MPAKSLLIPELDVSDLDRSLSVYTDVLRFRCHVSRPEERFAYLNLQIEVADVNVLYTRVQHAGLTVVIPLEERWYRQDQTEVGHRQFVMADPDGYLLRFFFGIGRRAAP